MKKKRILSSPNCRYNESTGSFLRQQGIAFTKVCPSLVCFLKHTSLPPVKFRLAVKLQKIKLPPRGLAAAEPLRHSGWTPASSLRAQPRVAEGESRLPPAGSKWCEQVYD